MHLTTDDRCRGLLLYRGPSTIDGKRIIVIATGLHAHSENRKTGPMIQTYILNAGFSPLDSARTGRDRCICGDCPHRLVHWGSCYVNLGQAPWSVWRAYRRGVYPQVTAHRLRAFRSRVVRLGSYGDPAAVPWPVWPPILQLAAGWTGYTHLWRSCDQRYRQILMASCDDAAAAAEAEARGWRVFRVRTPDESLLPGEIVCPASIEAGKRVTCNRCQMCQGTDFDRRSRPNVAIVVHGSCASRFRRCITEAA